MSSYQVIARKWRPQTFDEVVGQEHVTTTLRNSIATGRVGHAYLFTGIRGVGKTTAARILAKALNCANGPTPDPCNQCASCKGITAGSSLDVIEIDGASNRGIDSIRDLREAVAFAASQARHKVYIIDEVHMLTPEAFNALLKTLEEPPPHVVFVFATTELHKVPATILSRCQVFEFRRIGLQALASHLGKIAAAEGISAAEDALRIIAREADGSLRDACSLLDQVISFAGTDIQAEAVGAILRTGHKGAVESLLRAVLGEDPAGALRVYQDAIERGMPARQLLRDLARHLSECLRVSLLGPEAARDMGLAEAEIAQMHEAVAGRTPESLALLLNLLVTSADKAADSRSPELLAEAALVRASRLSSLASVEGLVARLEAVSRGTPMAGPGAPSPSAPSQPGWRSEPYRAAPATPPRAAEPPPSRPAATPAPGSASSALSGLRRATGMAAAEPLGPAPDAPTSGGRPAGSGDPALQGATATRTSGSGDPALQGATATRTSGSGDPALQGATATRTSGSGDPALQGATATRTSGSGDPALQGATATRTSGSGDPALQGATATRTSGSGDPALQGAPAAAPQAPAAPRRSEGEAMDLFLKHPVVDKVLGTFGGDIRKVIPE